MHICFAHEGTRGPVHPLPKTIQFKTVVPTDTNILQKSICYIVFILLFVF